MKISRLLSILFTSITTGLAGAFVFVLLNPEVLNQNGNSQTVENRTSHRPDSYADAITKTAPSVVNVFATVLTKDKDNTGKKATKESLGSGVVIGKNGFIITNYHVISDAVQIKVARNKGKAVNARVVGSDPGTDIAVLQATGEETLFPAPIATSKNLRVGDIVLAIGNPFSVGQTVTQGIVSATGRHSLGITTYENFIQTDAAINPGNSGGALINTQGKVIGINTAIFSKSGGSHGIGFAIPIDLAINVMQEIIDNGKVIRGWVGLNGQDSTPKKLKALGSKVKHGVLITGVLTKGPADLAGVLPGDLVFKINDREVKSTIHILNEVAATKPGGKLYLNIDRKGRTIKKVIVVQERPRNLP